MTINIAVMIEEIREQEAALREAREALERLLLRPPTTNKRRGRPPGSRSRKPTTSSQYDAASAS